jgi:superfamily II DNA or RNA helicase
MDERVTKLGIPHGVLMGGEKRERRHSSQVASIDTLYRMKHKPKAYIIVIDECHYALSRTFREVLAEYPEAKIIGMSATPALGNGKPLGVKSGGIFESMVRGPSVTELIRQGHLIGSRVFAPPPPPEMKGLKKTKTGEFDGEQGAAICDNSKVIGDIVDHWKRYSPDRKTAFFGFNQKYAFHVAESFRAAGINWAYVDADTPDGDIHTLGTRKFYWHQMDHGDLVGVSSVNTISIGWDRPCCKTIIFGSKTTSFPLFRQRLGRGSRPYGDYDYFLVMDHCGGLDEFPEAPFFESEVDWPLDGDPVCTGDRDSASRLATCKVPLKVPDSGVPILFHGPVSDDGKWMLPCYRAFKIGPDQCPYCGLPLEPKPRTIEVVAGELTERTAEMKAAEEEKIRKENERKAAYLDLVRMAKMKNYKPQYSSVVFKERFGYWPPKGWKEEVEAIV